MSWLHTWSGFAGWQPWWDLAVVLAAGASWLAVRGVVEVHNRRAGR